MYDVINMPDLIVRYFSSTPWLVIFIVSTIYLFFRLNNARKRAMLFAVIVFFLFVNALVIKVFTRLDQNSTYYRHLWAIPSIAVIGIAAIDLVSIIPRWYLKIPVIVALVIGVWFVNEQEYIRCRIQIFSTDGRLVPEDVIEIGDKLEEIRNESGKNTLFVVCPNGYERPYGNMVTELGLYSGSSNVLDSSILTNESHNGEEELTGGMPDIEYIMSTCCSKGIDYVIVSNRENVEKGFRNAGYNPVVTTDYFFLYKCEGYAGYRLDLISGGSVSWKSWYDKYGNPTLNSLGYCTEKYTYGRQGRRIADCFYDIQGNLCVAEGNGYGYAQLKRKFNSYGALEEERLYDANGNPCVKTNYGYSIIQNTYNGKLLIKQCYYDENENLINFDSRNPRATTLFYYDERGNCISTQFYDNKGKRSQAVAGYDEIRREYDSKNRMVRESFYANDILINRIDYGYAEMVREYDQSDTLIREDYLDDNGNLMAIP